MSAWDTYTLRSDARGNTKREASLKREVSYISRKVPESLSYNENVPIDGIPQNVTIINSDNLNEKLIYSLPGEDIVHGGLVEWMDNHWLVTERDANTTLYTKAKMIQCNHLLKWIDEFDTLHEQWSIVEDGTKYLTGEFEDRYFATTRGDSRIAVTVARNKDTAKLGREMRFLIDDPDTGLMLAYGLSKPLKMGWTYNNMGVYKFVMQEVETTQDDNVELGIADYYKHFPRESPITDPTTPEGKKVWL